jgi:hypothetical protein
VFIFLIIPFGIRLNRNWLGDAITEAEKTPGTPGIRAWLSPAEESAELLNALGASLAARVPVRAPLTTNGRLVLIGAALVTIGFFLPWFAFSPGVELSRMMGLFRAEGFPMPEMGGAGIPVKHLVQISGGSVANGLGWAVLLLGLRAALLPQVAQTVDAATQRTVRSLALGAGTILVLYLATQSVRAVAFGLCVTIAGYALEWLGISREQNA